MATSNQLCNAVSVRLDETNYPTWVFLMQHHLRGHGFLKFVDGSHPCPPQFLVGDDGSLTNNSAAREKWMEKDSSLISMITNTLSPEALTLVIGCSSAMEVWLKLKQRYATVSEAHIMQLKSILYNIQKGGDSIERYLLKFKSVRDQLAVLGVQISDQDMKALILAGLPTQYGNTRQIIRGENNIDLEKVRSLLLSAECEIELEHKTSPLSQLTAMIAQHGAGILSSNCSPQGNVSPLAQLTALLAQNGLNIGNPSQVQWNNHINVPTLYTCSGYVSPSSVNHINGMQNGYYHNNLPVLNGAANPSLGVPQFAFMMSNAQAPQVFSPQNGFMATSFYGMNQMSVSSSSQVGYVPSTMITNGRFMGVPSATGFQPTFISGDMLFNGSQPTFMMGNANSMTVPNITSSTGYFSSPYIGNIQSPSGFVAQNGGNTNGIQLVYNGSKQMQNNSQNYDDGYAAQQVGSFSQNNHMQTQNFRDLIGFSSPNKGNCGTYSAIYSQGSYPQFHNNRSNNTYRNNNTRPRFTNSNQGPIICQICEKPGHSASKCYYRNGIVASTSIFECQICKSVGHSANTCKYSQQSNNNSQNDPHAMVAHNSFNNDVDASSFHSSSSHLGSIAQMEYLPSSNYMPPSSSCIPAPGMSMNLPLNTAYAANVDQFNGASDQPHVYHQISSPIQTNSGFSHQNISFQSTTGLTQRQQHYPAINGYATSNIYQQSHDYSGDFTLNLLSNPPYEPKEECRQVYRFMELIHWLPLIPTG